ncbi:hypothetical protein RCH06_003030 [Polaromonas sp. CG_9.5]|uniref:GAF domain-containing protein n=1 Tax=Polaromonas sp. CG_9.5 TaxID=3071705 RepID=UPI002DFBD572|nr:hypothetical protein [Polaromonas sp. CG_9.5]
MSAQELDQQLAQFRSSFEVGGLHGALGFLNSRTCYRYTAIYRLDGQMMRNIHLYDRLGENPTHLSEIPLGDSFCQFVMKDSGFHTANSGEDKRLFDHAYRGIVNSYFGLPLSRKPGTIYGTLCHFDFEPMAISEDEIPLLEAVSAELMAHLD